MTSSQAASIIEPQLIDIPAGVLRMGEPACPVDADLYHRWHTGRTIRIGAFRLGRCAVTNAEYRAYVRQTGAASPSHTDAPGFNGDDQPVGGLSWEDAAAYCRWLADATGKPYRLPRDAEWEYAARGGREGARFPWGDDPDDRHACYGGKPAPAPVASFPPNGFGLYDMIGNIWQWCEDRFNDVSEGLAARNNPTGKDTADNRVLRGGSYLTANPLNLWIAYRHEDPPDLRHECLGMRVACGA